MTPVFPLKTVLFPGGPLPLRIFEARYTDMVSRCMRENSGFTVVAIRSGNETGPAMPHDIGTLARIADWYQERDGLLGIVVVGTHRVRIHDLQAQADGLRIARLEELPPEPPAPVPERHSFMADVLDGILDQLGDQYALIDRNFGDATWLGYRYAEILPMSLEDKQALLVMEDPLERLDRLAPLLNSLRTDG